MGEEGEDAHERAIKSSRGERVEHESQEPQGEEERASVWRCRRHQGTKGAIQSTSRQSVGAPRRYLKASELKATLAIVHERLEH